MNKNAAYMYVIIAAIILIVIIFFVGKSYGKNMPPEKVPVPDDDPGTGTSVSTEAEILQLTDDLYEDISGYTIFTLQRDMVPYQKLAASSDTDFVRVYNDWLERYYNKSGKLTLFEAIKDEDTWPTSGFDVLQQLANKFNRLNLS